MTEIIPIEKHRRVIDDDYRHRVAQLPCRACGRKDGICAHHRTGAGTAVKDDDHETFPLCWLCHQLFHSLSGMFADWDKELQHAWQDAMVAWTQRQLMPSEDVF